MRLRSPLFFAALLAVDLLPTPSFAGPAEVRAAADALFREGRTLVKQGKFAEGCAKLDASEKLDPAPGTLLALADCFEKDGRLASAWSTWNDAATMARQRKDARRLDTAEKRAKALEPKLPKVQIDVSPESIIPGLVVKRNDEAIDPAVFGSAIPVDPGEQRISASAQGREPWSTSVTIKPEPGVTNVRVPTLEKLPEPEVTPPPPVEKPKPPPPPPPRPPPSGAQKAVGIVITTLGVAGLAAGGVFGGLTFSNVSKAKELCDQSNPPRCSQEGLNFYQSADTTATISNIALGAGGGVLVLGIIVTALAPSSKPETNTSFYVRPWMNPAALGASIGGEF